MNEKRFSSNFYEEEGRTIADNGNELTQNEVVDLLNELNYENKELKKENEQLRKQLECNVIHKSVCSICKHHKLEQDTLYPQWHVSRCEKGKEECSKTTVSYCEYFERDNDE